MDIKVENYNNNVSFKYSNILKTLYKQDKLPNVKYGLYGKKLSKKTVSLEHIVPYSQGGKTITSNLALADKFENSKRGNLPIKFFLKPNMIKKYLKQFIDIKVKLNNSIFDGNTYIKEITDTLKKLDITV